MKMASSRSQNRFVKLLRFVSLSRMVENWLAGVSGSGACFSKVPKLFGRISGNSLCIFKTKASRGTKLCSYFCFYSLYNTWKNQLYRISRSYFYEWLFGPEKFSGLSRNGPQPRCLGYKVVLYSFYMCNRRPTDVDSDTCCNGRKGVNSKCLQILHVCSFLVWYCPCNSKIDWILQARELWTGTANFKLLFGKMDTSYKMSTEWWLYWKLRTAFCTTSIYGPNAKQDGHELKCLGSRLWPDHHSGS